MPTDYQGSSSTSFTSFGHSILSMKRDTVVHSINHHSHEATPQEHELEAFQTQVFQRFHDLSSVDSHELLSISWVSKLLDVFLCCQEQFRAILLNNKSYLSKHPLDKSISEYFERSVKGLDVCNAIRDGIEQIRQWQKQLEIVLCALNNEKSLGEAQFRRAKKGLNDLAIKMLDEKQSSSNFSHRNRSFGRIHKDSSKSLKHFRSLSWSVSRSWSASKQLQAIGNNINPPKTNEILATNGVSVAIYTMNYVLLFVMWALVASIPCQDRGLQSHFNVPKNFIWGIPILSLHERILEESKKREKRNSCGLLKEIYGIENSVRYMNGMIDFIHFPMGIEKGIEVRNKVEELGMVYGALKNGLDPLEKQVRQVFHRIVRSRTDGLDSTAR